jgi:glutamyl-tRNA reductase
MENMAPAKTFFAFGINHKTAPVGVRERLYLHAAEVPLILARLKQHLSECFVLSTCNRTEVYAVTDSTHVDIDFYKQILIDFKDAGDVARDEHFFTYVSCVATDHLLSVVSSIDSKVVGDAQIMRQVRNAYSVAAENGCTGKILNQLLQRAFRLAKRACSETAIRGGAVSVSLAAVKLAFETFGSLEGRTVMVIGAGETARFTAEALINKHVGKILVTNRTRNRAEQLLDELRESHSFIGEIVEFAAFKDRLSDVDIVISSTGSPEPILMLEDLTGIETRMLIIDIAVPRDIDPLVKTIPGVILKNVDDLNSVVDLDHKKRLEDIPRVKNMIREEMVDFLTWYYSLPLMPEYEKTGLKPSIDLRNEIFRVKEFLNQNMSEIHKLTIAGTGSFSDDLRRHFALIGDLQYKMRRSLMSVAA